jgi:hypothetical protein
MQAEFPTVFHNGIRITVAQGSPKRQLATDCPVTPAFREEINAWMREFFGMSYLVEPGQIYVIGGDTVLVHPQDYTKLKQEFKTYDGF